MFRPQALGKKSNVALKLESLHFFGRFLREGTFQHKPDHYSCQLVTPFRSRVTLLALVKVQCRRAPHGTRRGMVLEVHKPFQGLFVSWSLSWTFGSVVRDSVEFEVFDAAPKRR